MGLLNALKGDVYDTTGGKDVNKISVGSKDGTTLYPGLFW